MKNDFNFRFDIEKVQMIGYFKATIALLLLFNGSQLFGQSEGKRIFRIGSSLKLDTSAKTYKTLSSFLNDVTCLLPGDEIQLQEGDTFHGRLNFQECQNPAASLRDDVTIRTFKVGDPIDAPIEFRATKTYLVGSVKPTSLNLKWEPVNSVSYRGKTVQHLANKPIFRIGPLPSAVTQFYYDHWMMPVARHPSISFANKEPVFFPYSEVFLQSETGCKKPTCFKADPALKHLDYLVDYGFHDDAFVIVRNSPWSFLRSSLSFVNVTNRAGFAIADKITTEVSGDRIAGPGHGFILLNTLPLMDAPGEWYFDKESGYLYVHFWAEGDTANPFAVLAPDESKTYIGMEDSQSVQYKDSTIGFVGKRISKIKTLNIHNLTLISSTKDAIRILNADHINISHLNIHGTNGAGILVSNLLTDSAGKEIFGKKIKIDQISVKATASDGISISRFVDLEISNSTIEKAGFIGNQLKLENNFSGISISKYYNSVISGNIIAQTGYNGISAGEPKKSETLSSSLKIDSNMISDFLKFLNDGGGIYINGQELPHSDIIQLNKSITNNIIFSPVGSMNGTPTGFGTPIIVKEGFFGPTSGSGVRMIGAIYLDKKASYYTVSGNEVAGYYEPFTWFVRNGGYPNPCSNNIGVVCP